MSQLPGQIRLNVCAMVSEEESPGVLEVLGRLSRLGVRTFRDQGCILHCTLFMTQYADGVSDRVIEVARENTLGEREFVVECTGMSAPGAGWLFLDLDRAPLQKVADRLAEVLQPLRARELKRPSWLPEGTEKEAMFFKYGSPNVGSEFNPHISLACVEPPELLGQVLRDEKFRRLCDKVGKVQLRGIGVAEADDMGQFRAEKVLATIK